MQARHSLKIGAALIAALPLGVLFGGGPARPAGVSAQTGIGSNLYAVDCSGTSFCVAVGAGGTILQYNGSSWSSQPSGTSSDLFDVACPSTSFCVAVGAAGTILQYNGSGWTGQASGTGNDLFGVTCQGTSPCFAVGSGGTIQQYNGTVWTAASRAFVSSILGDIACPGTNFCFTVGRNGTINRYNGSSWSYVYPTSTTSNLTGVACPSTSICFAAGSGGTIDQYNVNQVFGNGSGWSTISSGTSNDLVSVACPSVSFCFAVGSSGTITQFNGSGWSLIQPGVTSTGLSDVACPSTGLCFAVGLNGTILQYNGAGWSLVSQGSGAHTVTYSPGWNLVALPAGTNLSGLAGPLYTWQAGDTGYETIQLSQGTKTGLGYWAYVPARTTLTLAAGSNTSTQISLPAGQWDMIGDPSGSEFAIVNGVDVAYAYDPINGYTSALGCGVAPAPGIVVHCAVLSPGEGAWIYSAAGSTVNISMVTAPPP